MEQKKKSKFFSFWGGKEKNGSPTDSEATATVSSPYSVKHTIHVDFNTSSGFRGLPKEWEIMLAGAISKDEVIENPDAVLDVLQFQSSAVKKQQAAEREEAPLPAEKNRNTERLGQQGRPHGALHKS